MILCEIKHSFNDVDLLWERPKEQKTYLGADVNLGEENSKPYEAYILEYQTSTIADPHYLLVDPNPTNSESSIVIFEKLGTSFFNRRIGASITTLTMEISSLMETNYNSSSSKTSTAENVLVPLRVYGLRNRRFMYYG